MYLLFPDRGDIILLLKGNANNCASSVQIVDKVHSKETVQ
jgi:hypothetical protein